MAISFKFTVEEFNKETRVVSVDIRKASDISVANLRAWLEVKDGFVLKVLDAENNSFHVVGTEEDLGNIHMPSTLSSIYCSNAYHDILISFHISLH